MDLADQFVRGGGNYCESTDPFTGSGVSPVFPNATNPQGLSIFHRNREGLLCLGAFDGHPLVETVHGTDAATRSISVAKVRERVHRLALGVDGLATTLRVVAPVRDQTPAQRIE